MKTGSGDILTELTALSLRWDRLGSVVSDRGAPQSRRMALFRSPLRAIFRSVRSRVRASFRFVAKLLRCPRVGRRPDASIWLLRNRR
jgi:hypothetical protein